MTQLVGIINLTPDSFSGDGLEQEPEKALARIDLMISDGASVIDIGAESTRPNARTLAPEEEWRRLAPVAEAVVQRKNKAQFSIDTRHVEVARKAVKSGFTWINDVSGGKDPAMIDLARDVHCTLVLMHSLSVPVDASCTLAKDADPVEEVYAWAQSQCGRLGKARFPREHLILDPGIGFGKTAQQSLALIKGIARLQSLSLPVMVGHSRKSFLSLFTDKPSAKRDAETLAVSCYLAERRVNYLRVHDVKSHAAMLRIREAL